MEEFVANPAFQAGVAPFLAALVVALALSPLRLGGLAIIAAFLVCMHLVTGIEFTPLTATRKILILAIAAAAIGPLLDFALKPTRIGVALIAVGAAGGALWAFWPVILQKPVSRCAKRTLTAATARAPRRPCCGRCGR